MKSSDTSNKKNSDRNEFFFFSITLIILILAFVFIVNREEEVKTSKETSNVKTENITNGDDKKGTQAVNESTNVAEENLDDEEKGTFSGEYLMKAGFFLMDFFKRQNKTHLLLLTEANY